MVFVKQVKADSLCRVLIKCAVAKYSEEDAAAPGEGNAC